MHEWLIKPSYKLDLACFCNLLTRVDPVIERHQAGYQAFANSIDARQDLLAFANSLLQQGLMIGTAAASLLSLDDYAGEDVQTICRLFDENSYHPLIEEYLIENGYSAMLPTIMQDIIPRLSSMLRYFHKQGFLEYWQKNCLPAIQARQVTFQQETLQYPVVTRVNQLLGSAGTRPPYVILYLCCFNAPYGIGLKNAFISDIRWALEDTVAVAVHELIHPPFARTRIKEMARLIWQDDFFREAKSRLPLSAGYPQPEDFLEENLVEGAHLYLSEQLGVETDPLMYLITHDSGSHVISAILYDALKQGYRDRAGTLEEVVDRLIEEGVLQPGQLRQRYLAIYRQAGLADQLSCLN